MLIVLFAACGQQDRSRQADTRSAAESHAGAQLFRIDPQQSSIRLRVYRDGPLARLGHNHVIVATGIGGEVYREKRLERSGFALKIPVSQLMVDRPADRVAAGPDFAGELSEFAIAGTRENMLGPKLLAAEQYPDIEIASVAIEGTQPDVRFTVELTVCGARTTLALPAKVEIGEQAIVVRGQLSLLQTQLGLVPFSVLGGGLRVRDAIDADYHLVAVRSRANAVAP
jgi:polyisoprenoid-binding protein YceI